MIAISCASVLASAIVLRVYHHSPISPVPSFIRRLLCSSTADSSITTTSGQSSETLTSDLSYNQEDSLHGQLATIMETPSSEVTADDQCVGEEKYVTEIKTDEITPKEMNNADWMKLALVLDKVFLACAIVAMVGTLSYCFIKFHL
ncbi:hypothetical protein HOLleu_25311 [Holothuria leucospilota]|uniref:Uncharacterized protein n=1 Tax=Holothuria leucospilota TaxID=206669 RepID=A0A9Q1BSN8_HOLLE|nr:hypothetical protein HOLleu_25311 [Holothuria leucospilota]